MNEVVLEKPALRLRFDHMRENVTLQKGLDAAVGPFSPEPGEKQFQGHVTLARLKNPRPADVRDLVDRAQSLAARSFGDWTALEVEIIRSELAAGGARHTLLARFPLGEKNA